MKLWILATSVFSKITRERGVGEGRTSDLDAKCYLRGESDEEQCCVEQDNDCEGCNPVLLADGIVSFSDNNRFKIIKPCDEQANNCFCDEACISIGGKKRLGGL
jgi:hypothetical protein